MVRSEGLIAAVVASCVLATSAYAVGTLAGTSVSGQAQATYTLAGAPQTSTSNTTTFVVAEVLDLNVTLQSSTVTVAAGDTSRTPLFTLTNTGNVAEFFPLALDNRVAGDDADPQTAGSQTVAFVVTSN